MALFTTELLYSSGSAMLLLRFASQHGTAAAVKKFSGELGSSKNAKLICRELSKLQKREIGIVGFNVPIDTL